MPDRGYSQGRSGGFGICRLNRGRVPVGPLFDCAKDGNDAIVIDQESGALADGSRRLQGMMDAGRFDGRARSRRAI